MPTQLCALALIVITVVIMMMVGVIAVVMMIIIVMMVVVISCGWSCSADCDYADNTSYCSDLP